MPLIFSSSYFIIFKYFSCLSLVREEASDTHLSCTEVSSLLSERVSYQLSIYIIGLKLQNSNCPDESMNFMLSTLPREQPQSPSFIVQVIPVLYLLYFIITSNYSTLNSRLKRNNEKLEKKIYVDSKNNETHPVWSQANWGRRISG